MAVDLEALKIAFCDEDTQKWSDAARQIGRLAVTNDDAKNFITVWLHQQENVHRFRHACCALASYLSESDATDTLLVEAQKREIVEPLVELTLASIDRETTIEQLEQLPGARERFEEWAETQSDKLRALVDKFEATGKTRAAEANKKKLAAIEGSGPTTPVPTDFVPSQPKFSEHSVWAVASYFAGVRHPRALGGLPLPSVVDALAKLGEARKAAGLPLVLGLPPMLERVGKNLDDDIRKTVVDRLVRRVPREWSGDRLHYNDYIKQLVELSKGAVFRELWEGQRVLPQWLADGLQETEALGRSGDKSGANRRAANLMREITRRCFADDWRWDELDESARFSLNVFALLVVHGPGLLADNPKLKPLRLSHRIALVVDAIKSGIDAREQVLPTLVRCLKLLLDRELVEHKGKPTLSDVCRRQIVIVQPLVAEWRLPGTLRKDLATIVCRVLLASFRHDRETFVELLYSVLYALPDQVLFREMVEYSTEEEMSAILESIVAGIEHWHGEADVKEAWVRYRAYVEGIVDTCGEQSPWANHLVGVLQLLSRYGGSSVRSADELADVFEALRAMLRAKQAITSASEELVVRRSDKKGAQWAARERDRKIEHETRAVFDRFQRVLDDIQILESDCLPEIGHPRPSDDLVRRWRRLIASLDDLGRLCASELPYLEREMSTHLLKRKAEELESRLFVLMRVLEKEEEDVAVKMLAQRVAQARGDGGDVANEDGALVQEWMLGRYMVRELASTLRFRSLQMLTSPWFVAFWILSPFVACSVLHLTGHNRWRGLPFAIATVANFSMVIVYFLESRRARSVTAGSGRFLLPQITAALFLGIMEVLAADEAWSLAVLEYPWVRGFTILAFLLAGYFFTREVLLGGQLKAKTDTKRKSRRAAHVMALVLWQSFVLVVLFALIGGRVMGDRADIDLDHYHRLAAAWGHYLPHEVHLGQLFLAPAEDNALYPKNPAYRIFPWAIGTWTVQVFFFSAIFERIMGSRD